MKKFYFILSAVLLSFCSCYAQSSFFTTVGEVKHSVPMYLANNSNNQCEDTIMVEKPSTKESSLRGFLSDLSILELEFVLDKYKEQHSSKDSSKGNRELGTPLHLYYGESRPLTIANVLAVMEEVGISNQLFVLAQSLLETGFYKSHVCNAYHNLFGLYDSRHKQYYHFRSWEDSVVGYKKFIQYRYKGGSYLAFLKRIGYAEDPSYITKVIAMSRKIKNKELDKGVF